MAVFIAIILVMIMMIVFMVVAINKTKERIHSRIEKDIEKHLNIYDTLFEERRQQLRALEKEIEENQNLIVIEREEEREDQIDYIIYASSKNSQQASYIDSHFFDDYVKVKNDFLHLSYAAMEETVKLLMKSKRDINVHEFKELLAIFDYQLQYQMYTLSSKDQLEVISSLAHHSMGKRRILQKYIEQSDEFNFRDFMNYLRDYIFYHDTVVYVYSSDGHDCLNKMPPHVLFLEDKTIGEGYIVKFREHIYDFSL